MQPSPGVQRKAGPGGQRVLGAGRKPQRDARPGPDAPCPTAAPALPAVGCRGPQLAGSSQGTAATNRAITTSQLMALGRGFIREIKPGVKAKLLEAPGPTTLAGPRGLHRLW